MQKYELIRKLLPLWLTLLVGSFSAIVVLSWLINLGFIAFDVCLSSAIMIGAIGIGCGIEMCFLMLKKQREPSYTYPSIIGSIYVLPVILGLSARFITPAGVFSIIIYAGLLVRIAWLMYVIQLLQSRRPEK